MYESIAQAVLPIDIQVWYVLVFGLAAVACLVSLLRVRKIEHTGTRQGLSALLAMSAVWALSHVGYLSTTDYWTAVAFHEVGLLMGIATVGAWLYFCSAYTGRSLHHNPRIRQVAIAIFLTIAAIKLTNHWHGLYFTATATTAPFPHIAISNGILHWTVMGGAYALASVGYFMLFERFRQVSHNAAPLAILVALTGLPIGLDILGLISPALLDITYEPLGVAIFAVGLMFVYVARFETIRLAGEGDDPVVVLDERDRVQDFNRAAARLLPALTETEASGGEVPFEEIVPGIADLLAVESPIIELQNDSETRYYRVTEHPFSAGRTTLGRGIVFSDVTQRERYRKELERQNDRLEEFASMLSHDLRNPLNVAQGRLELAREDRDDDHLESVAEALDRMETLIEDVLAIARQGQPVDEREPVDVGRIARQAWEMVDTRQADLHVSEGTTVEADPDRLQQLLENLVRNAVEHGGEDVTVTVGPLEASDGFFLADDGSGIAPEDHDAIFESGYTTAEDGTGFGLAIVEQIVDAHGWTVALADSQTGTRFEIQT
ncbi:ATP-binding protein [Halorhabdus sp. CUG00001]|uniref:sensor histidine kinase n=1 Tax=Halorhabdus sp. CUG00001 TaxID=2600297 RepID=UPI00131AAC10|nr:ATP-binding protein [Halorhabdus sp. CUG00001]